MEVFIVGGHGQVALRLLRRLADAGHSARATVRKPEHAAEVEATGATAVSFDLEAEQGLAEHVAGAGAVVFAAGAGPGSGAERKRTVDLGGALALVEACKQAGVSRYLMISSMGIDDGARREGPMKPYFEAKGEADEALRGSGLEFTIVRPGRLTDAPGRGLIEVGTPLDHFGEVSRDDVAATLVAVLAEPATIGVSFDLLGGETPIEQALAGLAR